MHIVPNDDYLCVPTLHVHCTHRVFGSKVVHPSWCVRPSVICPLPSPVLRTVLRSAYSLGCISLSAAATAAAERKADVGAQLSPVLAANWFLERDDEVLVLQRHARLRYQVTKLLSY